MPPLYLLLLVFLGAVLVLTVQMEIISIAFQRLGLSPGSALLLMLGILAGSGINIPIGSIAGKTPSAPLPGIPAWGRIWRPATPLQPGRIIIAVNLGGCIIPVGIALHLLASRLVAPLNLLLAMPVISVACYLLSRPVPGVGIAMPIFLAPMLAVMTALALAPENAAPLAFSAGVLGVLLGADLLRLRDIREMGVAIAAIGGAGTFDGIFLTGVIAVLLA